MLGQRDRVRRFGPKEPFILCEGDDKPIMLSTTGPIALFDSLVVAGRAVTTTSAKADSTELELFVNFFTCVRNGESKLPLLATILIPTSCACKHRKNTGISFFPLLDSRGCLYCLRYSIRRAPPWWKARPRPGAPCLRATRDSRRRPWRHARTCPPCRSFQPETLCLRRPRS